MPNRDGETADEDLIKSLRGTVRVAEENAGDSDAGDEEGESQDEQASNSEEGKKGEEPEADPTEAKFNKWVDELVESLEKGDTNNKVYKGLQKVIGRKDGIISAQEAKLALAELKLREAEDVATEMSQGMAWLSETLLENLPDDRRQDAANKLLQRQNQFLSGKLRQGAVAPPAQQAQPQDEASRKIAEYKQQFLDSRRAAVKRAGFNPDDPAIDYGDENDPLLSRIETFDASLEKLRLAKEEERIQKVSKKPPAAETRSGGGGIPAAEAAAGPDRLARGVNARLDKLRKLGII